MLAYFQHADYIITDTFHGSVFSIKYGKKFATIIREANVQKLTDLLERFSLCDRIVTKIQDLESVLKKEIDVASVQEKIEKEVEKSKQYLEKSMK